MLITSATEAYVGQELSVVATSTQFGNSLLDAATKAEVKALRLVTIHNRMVLDQLTAVQGGVCVLVGTSCCKSIPDNYKDGHIISQALHNPTMLHDGTLLDNVI